MQTFMDELAAMPLPAIKDETTDELLNGRTNHCYATITDPNPYYPQSYRQEKANELRAIAAELIRRGVISGMPQVITDALADYPEQEGA